MKKQENFKPQAEPTVPEQDIMELLNSLPDQAYNKLQDLLKHDNTTSKLKACVEIKEKVRLEQQELKQQQKEIRDILEQVENDVYFNDFLKPEQANKLCVELIKLAIPFIHHKVADHILPAISEKVAFDKQAKELKELGYNTTAEFLELTQALYNTTKIIYNYEIAKDSDTICGDCIEKLDKYINL